MKLFRMMTPAVACGVLALWASQVAAQSAHLVMAQTPVNGAPVYWDETFPSETIGDWLNNAAPELFTLGHPDGDGWPQLLLSVDTRRLNAPITLGTYNNALSRGNVAGQPGFSIYVGQVTSGQVQWGSFTLSELTLSDTGQVAALALSFDMNAGGVDGVVKETLRGSFSFSNPAAIPEPGSATLLVLGLCGWAAVARRHRQP